MGVRGLTTYILQRRNLYMDDYEVPQNSILILDGDSIAANIFIEYLGNKSCFGGDYEIYADGITKFFAKLSDCKITPYILLDGAIEDRKFETVKKRIKERIEKIIKLNCTNEDQCAVYPLHLWPVFVNVLQKLNIQMVICDYECDGEVASIAKQLDCPVLSNDSDYFIFDVKFIPYFVTIQRNQPNLYVYRKLETDAQTNIKKLNMYLRCKIFNREKFLMSVELSKPLLPVLALYLGNDFVSRKNPKMFYKHLNLEGETRGISLVEIILKWLADKNYTEAIDVMCNYIKNTKNMLDISIEQIVDNYQCKQSKYLRYFGTNLTNNEFHNSDDTLGTLPQAFLNKYRKGFYHHHFLNILSHKYFPKTLVEEVEKNHSHTSSFPILSVIHEILTNASAENLVFYGRIGLELGEQIIPKYNKYVPTYQQLETMNLQDRIRGFLDNLNIPPQFVDNCVKLFPASWQMLLITMKYVSIVSSLEWSFIKSLILSKIVISYIDKRIGLVRSWKDFERYVFVYTSFQRKPNNAKCLSEALEEIDLYDSIAAIRELLPYFQISEMMRNDPNLYDRSLVHCLSEFQSCFLHIDMLNDIFNRPFEKCSISEFFNGSFIYNVFNELRYRNTNLIDQLLRKSPISLHCFKFSVSLLENKIEAS